MKIYIICNDDEIISVHSCIKRAKVQMELLNYKNILQQLHNNSTFDIHFNIREYEIDKSLTKFILFDPTEINDLKEKSEKIRCVTQKLLDTIENNVTLKHLDTVENNVTLKCLDIIENKVTLKRV